MGRIVQPEAEQMANHLGQLLVWPRGGNNADGKPMLEEIIKKLNLHLFHIGFFILNF